MSFFFFYFAKQFIQSGFFIMNDIHGRDWTIPVEQILYKNKNHTFDYAVFVRNSKLTETDVFFIQFYELELDIRKSLRLL